MFGQQFMSVCRHRWGPGSRCAAVYNNKGGVIKHLDLREADNVVRKRRQTFCLTTKIIIGPNWTSRLIRKCGTGLVDSANAPFFHFPASFIQFGLITDQ